MHEFSVFVRLFFFVNKPDLSQNWLPGFSAVRRSKNSALRWGTIAVVVKFVGHIIAKHNSKDGCVGHFGVIRMNNDFSDLTYGSLTFERMLPRFARIH